MTGSLKASKTRKDGWTAERQLRFLDALARTRSVTKAAAFVGMSRESAYRLRARRDGALFAATWNRALKAHKVGASTRPRPAESSGISRANPSKVTKCTKSRDPHFDTWQRLLRDLRERS